MISPHPSHPGVAELGLEIAEVYTDDGVLMGVLTVYSRPSQTTAIYCPLLDLTAPYLSRTWSQYVDLAQVAGELSAEDLQLEESGFHFKNQKKWITVIGSE